MNDISIDDYLCSGQNVIFPKDIDERIDYLAGQLASEYAHESDADEYAGLVAFRLDAGSVAGKRFGQVTIVPESRFTAFARDEAHGISDLDIVDSYVRWEEFAQGLRADGFIAVAFGDDLVYVR